MKEAIKDWVFENGSYKLVALFITLILWVSVLGRKETTMTKEVEVNLITSSNYIVTSYSARTVRYEITGSRRSLRKFVQEKTEPLVIDLTSRAAGRVAITPPDDTLKLPFGSRIQNVSPSSIVVELEEVTKKKLPIAVDWRDSKEANRVLLNAQIDPKEIWIEGGRQTLSTIREIITLPVSSQDAVEINGKNTIKTKIRWPEKEGIVKTENIEVTITY